MTSGKLNGILYTCTWFPKLGKYNLKNIILILIKKKNPYSHMYFVVLYVVLWTFVVYQNKFRPSYIPQYIDSGFTSVSSWHRLCMQQFWSDPSTSANHQTPANGLVTNLDHFLTTTIPVYYKMQVCVFNCMGVIKNRWAFERGHINLEKHMNPSKKKSKKTKSLWRSRV